MKNLMHLNDIKEMYNSNINIIQHLRDKEKREQNSLEDIIISYDFQAGSYIEYYEKNSKKKDMYCKKLANIINTLGKFDSLLEIGVGEATTLVPLIKNLTNTPIHSYGCDISWSRIKYANKFINMNKISNATMFLADLFCMPILDNSIDIVYTSHSIEPNGGREKEALIELYRITKNYLILLEPSYEFANDEGKNRMNEHGYVKDLYNTSKQLGFNVIKYELFEESNKLNPTAVIVIKKDSANNLNKNVISNNPLCCPITKEEIIIKYNTIFSKDSLLAYPIIGNIPCFLPNKAIIATKFLEDDYIK